MNQQRDSDGVQVYSISPRANDKDKYWKDICEVITYSDLFGFSGVLCFAGKDTMIEPWLVANHVCAKSTKLRPLVATNPIYMHPFTAAKMVVSLYLMHGRRVDINLITGTSLVEQDAFNDLLTHDERYDRLSEYAEVLRSLIFESRPLTYSGKYFKLTNAVLRPRIDKFSMPTFYLAGKSAAAKAIGQALGAIELTMLRPQLQIDLNCSSRGMAIYLGIITRQTEDEAWEVASKRFPPDREGEMMLDFSMKHTDSQWKVGLWKELTAGGLAKAGYWLEPFRSFRADCPYFVGSHENVGKMIENHVKAGVRGFVIDMWPSKEDFQNVRSAFDLANVDIS